MVENANWFEFEGTRKQFVKELKEEGFWSSQEQYKRFLETSPEMQENPDATGKFKANLYNGVIVWRSGVNSDSLGNEEMLKQIPIIKKCLEMMRSSSDLSSNLEIRINVRLKESKEMLGRNKYLESFVAPYEEPYNVLKNLVEELETQLVFNKNNQNQSLF